jgi:hypothetical protein
MTKKLLFVFLILFAGSVGLFAAELSGTYDKDFTVTTDFNTIGVGKTLHVTNGATYVMRDATVYGSIIVDKGCKFISPDDYEGWLVFKPGSHIEGIDFYYKVRVSDDKVLVRKIPMTFDEIWNSGNRQIIEVIGEKEYCYMPEVKGWVTLGEVRNLNPFNENIYENYAFEYTMSKAEADKDAPPPTTNEISGTYKKDYTVKTELNVVSKGKTLRVKKGVTFIMTDAIVSGSIVVDKGGSLIAAGDQKGYLAFKQGSSLKGIDLYYKVRFTDDTMQTRKIPMTLDEIWKSKNQELIDIVGNMEFCYSTELKGWVTINEIRFMNPFNEDFGRPDERDNPQPVSNGGGEASTEPAPPPAPASRELSGTYDKDYTVRTDFNTIAAGKTLHVTKGATYVMRDAIVHGCIIVDKGCKFISPADYEGYLVFKPGAQVKGIDLYYKVRVSDSTAFTRKIPMTLEEVWKSKNQELIDLVGNMEFCYSPELKGWVTINEIRFMNPFNENLYDEYDMVFTKSVSRIIENECRSLIVKNKAKVVVQPNPGCWGTKIHESIIVESGSSLLGTGSGGHKLQLKKGVKIQGLPLYVRVDNRYVAADTILDELWKLPPVSGNEYYNIAYSSDLKGWYFEDITLSGNDLPKAL